MDSNGHLETTQSMTSDSAGILPPVSRHSAAVVRAGVALMAAVLRKAVTDFRQYAADERPIGQHLFRLASEWIASRDVSWPYSFENIQQTFDIDAHRSTSCPGARSNSAPERASSAADRRPSSSHRAKVGLARSGSLSPATATRRLLQREGLEIAAASMDGAPKPTLSTLVELERI